MRRAAIRPGSTPVRLVLIPAVATAVIGCGSVPDAERTIETVVLEPAAPEHTLALSPR